MRVLQVNLVASGEYITEAVVAEHNAIMLQIDGQGVGYVELSIDGDAWSLYKTFRCVNGTQAVMAEMLPGTMYRVKGSYIERVLAISENIGGGGEVSGASKAADVTLTPIKGLDAKNVQDAVREVSQNVSAAKAIGDAAQAAADAAQTSADAAQRTATDAYNTASGLSGQVNQAKADAAAAQQAAVGAGAAAQQVAGDLDKVEADVEALKAKKVVMSETLTHIESITQSAYDAKKAFGELSDTTAYLITE